MSKELDSIMMHHHLTEFWGGVDRGTCLQVTCDAPRNEPYGEGYIQLTRGEATALYLALEEWLEDTP